MALEIFTLPSVTIDSGGVAKPLTENAGLFAASITIQAGYDNVGRVSLGSADVTISDGIQIAPGETAVIEYPASAKFTDEFRLSSIYIVSGSAGDEVRVTYIKRG